tara:strand:- start:345 stop:1355 length:1011 start_codon:yes stop_codon:yes gene_type:complete
MVSPIFFLIPLILLFLHYGKFFLVPLSISLFIFIVVKSISSKLIDLFGKKINIKINKFFSFILVFSTLLLLFYFTWEILKFNILSVSQKANLYQENLIFIIRKISENSLVQIIKPLIESMENINFGNLFTLILGSLTSFAGSFSLVLIYIFFFIAEEKFFIQKLNQISKNKKTLQIIKKVNLDIFNYFQLKSLTSSLTGILTFVLLFSINCDLAILFGILAFFLNFIPFLGSLLAVIFPFIFVSIQFLELFQPLIVLFSLIFIQILVGNILEPKIIGKSLNLSPLIMIIVLSIMGKLWGIIGMFLSVPFLVVLLIVLSNFKSTKKIALFISERGIP